MHIRDSKSHVPFSCLLSHGLQYSLHTSVHKWAHWLDRGTAGIYIFEYETFDRKSYCDGYQIQKHQFFGRIGSSWMWYAVNNWIIFLIFSLKQNLGQYSIVLDFNNQMIEFGLTNLTSISCSNFEIIGYKKLRNLGFPNLKVRFSEKFVFYKYYLI